MVRLLVERDNVEADSKDRDDQTPLSLAAERGHEAVVRLLVDVDPDSRDDESRTPLFMRQREATRAVVRLLQSSLLVPLRS